MVFLVQKGCFAAAETVAKNLYFLSAIRSNQPHIYQYLAVKIMLKKKRLGMAGFCFGLGCLANVYAQKEVYSVCSESYFTDSKVVSAKVCLDSAGKFGLAEAFNIKGKRIYTEKEVRFTAHGHTFFTYYPNGAVYKANYRFEHPGGTRWFIKTYKFTDKGKLISINEEGSEEKN
jgi:hypothetical protein